jgi:hypothetical protein
MSETVQIGRFRADYHLRPSQFGEAARLDGVMRDVTAEALELALERAGVRASEVVCIRSIRLAVRLRLSRANSALAADWARLLAEAIRDAAADRYNAVHYRSRPLALIDMGVRLAEGRFERVWAWRQLGFWQGEAMEAVSVSAAAREFGGALAREPGAAVSVLAALGAQGLLLRLAPHLEWGWVEMAAAVLRAAGLADDFVQEPTSSALQQKAGGQWVQECVARALERSQILRDCREARMSEGASRAVALLAVLETEPWLVRAGGQLFEAARALHERVFGAAVLQEPRPAVGGTPVAGPPPVPSADARVSEAAGPPRKGESASAEMESSLRAEAFSEFGGLLFLIRLLDQIALPERALESERIEARGLRWFLHRLALALQPLAADDPAALAFCGLPPSAPHPSLDEPAPSEEEQEVVDAFAEEVRAALSEALPEPPRAPAALMQFVCRRSARIVADPGWIELRFDLLDVSTEIRRAGLDLDPNYVPWLGIVLRFVYE